MIPKTKNEIENCMYLTIYSHRKPMSLKYWVHNILELSVYLLVLYIAYIVSDNVMNPSKHFFENTHKIVLSLLIPVFLMAYLLVILNNNRVKQFMSKLNVFDMNIILNNFNFERVNCLIKIILQNGEWPNILKIRVYLLLYFIALLLSYAPTKSLTYVMCCVSYLFFYFTISFIYETRLYDTFYEYRPNLSSFKIGYFPRFWIIHFILQISVIFIVFNYTNPFFRPSIIDISFMDLNIGKIMLCNFIIAVLSFFYWLCINAYILSVVKSIYK